MSKLSEILASKKILVSDGAWGTSLFMKGLVSGDCPELWNLTHENEVIDIAKSYIEAGSDIIGTNSFGGSSLKLKQYGLDEKTYIINKTAALISRKAAGNDKLVFGSIGPTGKFLITGEVTEEELYSSFKEQASALVDGGIDIILLETFYALDEAEIAVKSVKENLSIPVACTFTFDKQPDGNFKTIMGVSISDVLTKFKELDVDIAGSNCGSGFGNLTEIAEEFRKLNKNIPLLIQPNAGLPQNSNGRIVYSETPELIIPYIERLIELKVNIIGGCCGTTPEHIKTIRKITNSIN